MSLSPHLNTPRLRLRPVMIADGPVFERHLGRFEVARMLTSVPYPYPPGLFAAWFSRLPDDGGATYTIEADGELIGCASLSRRPPDTMSLGYWLAPESWGRGYATEVGAALRDAAFAETGVPRLFARRIADNAASGRVLEKLGFVETGSFQHFCESRSETVTSLTYRLDREAWLVDSVSSTPTLATPRLSLRALLPGDEAPIAEQVDDIEVSSRLALVPHPYTIDDARAFLAHSARQTRLGRGVNFGLIFEGALIGVVGARNLDAAPEIGWWLARPFWGRGFMSEAVEAVLINLFARGARRIEAGAFKDNAASLRIQEKMGFSVTAEGERHCMALGHDLPHLETVLTREAFAARGSRTTDQT